MTGTGEGAEVALELDAEVVIADLEIMGGEATEAEEEAVLVLWVPCTTVAGAGWEVTLGWVATGDA